ncbi:MAG: radical SAM protein [Thermodesulfobacteriota bacterium]
MPSFDPGTYRDAKKRRVLFVIPPQRIEEHYGRLADVGARLPWLGLTYVIAAVRDAGHDVRLVDCEVEDLTVNDLYRIVQEFDPDVIGASAVITNVSRCFAAMEAAKRAKPEVLTVLGGPQITIFPEQALKNPAVDMIVLSEGEITMCEILLHLDDPQELGRIPGTWARSNGQVCANPLRDLIDDLDSVPPPALDLFDLSKYHPAAYIWGKRVLPILSARGCTFSCRFCEAKLTFRRRFRHHSASRIVGEIKDLMDSYGADSFQFMDDIFTLKKRRVHELCDKILESGRTFKWSCFTRTDCIDPGLLAKMREAGCYLICFGCESGDQKLLDLIDKKLTVEKNRHGIALTRESGIKAFSTFMLGLPTETREQSLMTIDFAVQSKLDYAIFPILEPYPGTEIYQDAIKLGYFLDTAGNRVAHDYEGDKTWVPNGRDRAELEKLSFTAMRRFYLRPRILLSMAVGMVRNLPTRRLFKLLWGGVKYFLKARRQKVQGGTRY